MSATLATRTAPVTAERGNSRMKTAATWLFVLPLLTEGVLPGVVKLQVAGLAVLAFVLVGSGRELPHRAVERVFAVAAVLTLTVIGYVAFGSWPQGAGTARAYDGKAVLWVVTYVLVAVFAVLFFEAALFERVMWRGATVALWIGMVSCAVSRLTGHLLLVNPAYGTARMTGTLSEPSDWAPLLAVVLILALRRKSWLCAVLAIAGLALADSPTCMLVMALAVPLYCALTTGWRYRVPLLAALAIAVACAGVFVQRADYQAWLNSGSTAEVAVGRLVSGIRNAETGGEEGQNARYANIAGVMTAARDGGWVRAGAGPGADAVYFPAVLAQGDLTPATANSLWSSVAFDFGEWGLAALVALMLAAVWRLRRYPLMCALLLPFLISSMVNSSVPDWSMAALAVLLFTLPRPAGLRRSA
jgi:hypothetical protein